MKYYFCRFEETKFLWRQKFLQMLEWLKQSIIYNKVNFSNILVENSLCNFIMHVYCDQKFKDDRNISRMNEFEKVNITKPVLRRLCMV